MRGRKFFAPGRPRQFEVDGLAILGVAVGVKAIGATAADRDWLAMLAKTALNETTLSEWDASLAAAALLVVGDVAQDQPIRADVRAALASLGLVHLSQAEETAAVSVIAERALEIVSPVEGAVQLAALRWLLRSAANALPGKATVTGVADVLRSLSHSLKRWPWESSAKTPTSSPQRWDIRHEYHVQSLVWAVLAPILPDLEDEEYLRSLGHKHPRVDLAVPSLALIIEVKYLRQGTPKACAALIGQVAEDTGLYLSRSKTFREILVFVWDDSRSTEQHAELRQGLVSLNGVVDAIIIPRPGGWS